MSDLKRHLDEQLKNPEFAAEWERQRPEREYIKAIIAARIENGNCSPTIATLQQIADGVGKTLHIEFR